ncbi:MAG: DNA methyltransferase, partial [Prevotella sp.]|nr:DNA methyltransferase [Prevotella sp.]
MEYKDYIKELDRLFQVGNTTEHSFRGTLQAYLSTLLPGFIVTNEPRRFECGAPDYVITKTGLPVAFLEAKDIDDGDLDGRRAHKEQFNRYKTSLDGIAFTDYLDFHFYEEGEFVDAVRIAETRGSHIVGIQENKGRFEELILHLATKGRQKITSSSALARQMAAKAHLLAETVRRTIALEGEDSDTEIAVQLRAFRDVLIHDLKADEFADIYAQTIVYGMFTARLNDNTPDDFSRKEAAELIPKTNPFLRKVFQSIAGYDIDGNIEWIVDDLASMFAATDAIKIMKNYGNNNRHSDPIVHFYEDFLAEYDPKLRKARGVWYTPAPVVKFIVKSVDEILQTEFGLHRGLAVDSTIKIKRAIEQSKDKRTTDGMKHEEVEIPRVQILDPATGTGTFLAEIIQQVRDKFDGIEGMWPSYVEKSLIPRLHGFEILMASYTIAHLKLSMTLKATGYEGQTNHRLNVFLTNSLEEATPRATTLWAKWLSDEADAASRVKTETPIMIATGNPPYSISSQNAGKWITNLVSDYKRNLNEKNIQPLSDDYIKFIRLGQYYVDKNGEGVLAYISNNGFLDGIIHRQMRKSLLESFDKIYILNLHGNSRRKETSPDGGPDENV